MPYIDWKRRTLRIEEGAILPAAKSACAPQGYNRLYILVHGFNNTREQADDSYQAFRRRVGAYIGPHLSKRIWEFYWPGYEEQYKDFVTLLTERVPANSIVTAYNYHKQVPKAVEFGKLLGAYILDLRAANQDTEVVFIGHSLGCRLILEAVAHVADKVASEKIPAILLMAAAIPVRMVEPQGPLREAAKFPKQSIALYSHRDLILSTCFPPGQTRANDGGILPQAVGWRGRPDNCWTGRQRTYLSHGQYWTRDDTTPNIVRLFGKVTAHVLPYSEVLPWKLPNRILIPRRNLRSRILRTD